MPPGFRNAQSAPACRDGQRDAGVKAAVERHELAGAAVAVRVIAVGQPVAVVVDAVRAVDTAGLGVPSRALAAAV